MLHDCPVLYLGKVTETTDFGPFIPWRKKLGLCRV